MNPALVGGGSGGVWKYTDERFLGGRDPREVVRAELRANGLRF